MSKASAPVPVVRCEACRRHPHEIKVGRLSAATIPGIGEMAYLCTDVVDCRRHWPTEAAA